MIRADRPLLYAVDREALVRSLLAEMGVVEVTRRGDELWCSCPLPFGLHAHGDRNPSFSVNTTSMLANCLAGETVVKTYEGEFPIRDLAGGVHRLLDGRGWWVDAEVRSFGEQPLMKVTLTRNKVEKVVYATPDHGWLRRAKGKYADGSKSALVDVSTRDLQPGYRLPSVWPRQRAYCLGSSPFGIARGFVFGDGSRTDYSARAMFFGEKDAALLPYFAMYESHEVRRSDGVMYRAITSGLPRSWKDLPSRSEGTGFLYGWLQGYFAADGYVDKFGCPAIVSARHENLEHFVSICDRVGIGTYGITRQDRKGYGDEKSPIYSLTLRRETLRKDFFVIPEHQARFVKGEAERRYERTHWCVRSVEETERFEEVFCAVVPTTHSFVLAGNLLTRNCWVCGGGTVEWLVATCRGWTMLKARGWLADQGSGDDPEALSALLGVIDALYAAPTALPPIPHMNDRVLEPWRLIHPYLTDRGVLEETIISQQVGYDQSCGRVVIPHWWKGHLVGWQSRRVVDDGTPKYLSTPGFPKDRTIYHLPSTPKIVVLESPMSVLRHLHHAPEVAATFGSSVTDRQVRILARYEGVVLWLDNDFAGWSGTVSLVERLSRQTVVWVVQSPFVQDAGDLDDATVEYLLAECVVPYSVWERPDDLLDANDIYS